MPFSDAAAKALTRLVGTPYSRMDCWRLVSFCFASQGVDLPTDYFTAAETRFRTLRPSEDPKPFDVVVIRNHPVITNHCGLYLGNGQVLHSMQDTGVVCQPLMRIARVEGFLRLKR